MRVVVQIADGSVHMFIGFLNVLMHTFYAHIQMQTHIFPAQNCPRQELKRRDLWGLVTRSSICELTPVPRDLREDLPEEGPSFSFRVLFLGG